MMSFWENEDCLVWSCDGQGCDAELTFERVDRPGYFMSCVDELKDRGWCISRTNEGEWSEWRHKCPKCRKTDVAKLLAMPSSKFGAR
jgi:hypothetical protein